MKRATAACIIIGNEILSGRIQDKNLLHLAAESGDAGIELLGARVVRDLETEIIDAIQQVKEKVTYVFTSGGIGPTHDDVTASGVSRAFGRKLILHPEAVSVLREYYSDKGIELNEARLKMAILPQGASLIANPVSGAPGFQIENLFALAGVPRVFQAMLGQILPGLRQGRPRLSVAISAALKEGDVAIPLAALQKAYPGLELGSYPSCEQETSRGTPSITLVAYGRDAELLAHFESRLRALIEDLGAEPCKH